MTNEEIIIAYMAEHQYKDTAENRRHAKVALGLATAADIRAEIAHYRRVVRATKSGSPQVARVCTSHIRELQMMLEKKTEKKS